MTTTDRLLDFHQVGLGENMGIIWWFNVLYTSHGLCLSLSLTSDGCRAHRGRSSGLMPYTCSVTDWADWQRSQQRTALLRRQVRSLRHRLSMPFPACRHWHFQTRSFAIERFHSAYRLHYDDVFERGRCDVEGGDRSLLMSLHCPQLHDVYRRGRCDIDVGCTCLLLSLRRPVLPVAVEGDAESTEADHGVG